MGQKLKNNYGPWIIDVYKNEPVQPTLEALLIKYDLHRGLVFDKRWESLRRI